MVSMDRALYNLKFDLEFLSKTGNEYQSFFSQIMSARYPGDFIATRPWGRDGDEKCDGYILSSGSFYQVYAPDELEAKAAVSKMQTDFAGALVKWGDKINSWIFVHNSRNGVPPHVLQQLTTFKKDHPEIMFSHMGKSELKSTIFETSDKSIRDILGAVPTYEDVNNLSMESIKRTLVGIANSTPPANNPIDPVSQRKLDANGLSNDTKSLLELGMIKSKLVEKFFAQWYDPSLEEKTAAEMNYIYRAASEDYLSPDDVFGRIFRTVGGKDSANPVPMVSTLTIMAYFFQTCDIFKNPREEASM